MNIFRGIFTLVNLVTMVALIGWAALWRELDRYHLARMERQRNSACDVKQHLCDKLLEQWPYVNRYSEDMSETRNWKWWAVNV